MNLKSILKNKKTKIGAGILSLGLLLPGCATSFQQGREKIDFGIAGFPLVGGGGGFNHKIFKTDACREIESRLNTSVSVNAFGGKFEMKIYGEGDAYLGKYILEGLGKNINNYDVKFYDSKNNLFQTLDNIPENLPTQVFFSNIDWIKYRDRFGHRVNYNQIDESYIGLLNQYHKKFNGRK